MLSRTRVSRALDVSRLAAAVSKPGIDPRVFATIAYANADSVVSSVGHFVDVTLADGTETTAQVGADYVGPGFGIYVKVRADDELVVVVPEGDLNHGAVVVKRLYSNADSPPDLAISNPNDIVLVVEQGKDVRLALQGSGELRVSTDSGDVSIASTSGTITAKTQTGDVVAKVAAGRVMLGSEGLLPTQGVVQGEGVDAFTGLTYAALGNASLVVLAKKEP